MINWQEIGADDFSAMSPCKKYFLRAEYMGNYWWWCVYYKGETISNSMFSGEPATTKKQALKAAEKCYKKHVNKTK
jgi:hypothetical protein